MALTKQRKILGGVMAIGLGALAVDRLVLGPPEQASASQPTQPVSPSSLEPGATTTDDDAKSSLGEGLPSFEALTQRLSTAAEAGVPDASGDDPFTLPDGWQAAAALADSSEPIDRSAFANKLLADYRLSGISKSGDEHLAVINGLPIRVGQVVRLQIGDEVVVFQLIRIDNPGREVVWRSRAEDGELVVMSVPDVLD